MAWEEEERLISHQGMAICEILYNMLRARICAACKGTKGSQIAAARKLNVLPNEDDDAILIYLHAIQPLLRLFQRTSRGSLHAQILLTVVSPHV